MAEGLGLEAQAYTLVQLLRWPAVFAVLDREWAARRPGTSRP